MGRKLRFGLLRGPNRLRKMFDCKACQEAIPLNLLSMKKMIGRQSKAFAPLLLGMTVGCFGCDSAENTYVAPPPPEVTVAIPLQQSVTPFIEENGVVEAVDQAEVRARVQGFVEEIKFKPGELVAKGDLLYLIEPDQYQAAVKSAKAAAQSADASIAAAKSAVATAEAEVKVSEQNLSRQKRLAQQDAGTQADLDSAIAAKDSALAKLDSAKANVEVAEAEKARAIASREKAQLELDYTTVESPIGGRISTTDIKQGNLVESGTKLATVVDRTRVYVNFSISDRQMLRFVQERYEQLKPGEEYAPPDVSEFPAYIGREIDDGFPFVGTLDYVDQEGIDADTGTFGMRAEFDNPNDQLFPGLFVSIRVPTGDPVDQMLIPESAILRDQTGQYVRTVDDQNKVQRTPISIGQSINGWAIIAGGLDADARVVVDGIQRARPGLEVAPVVRELSVDTESLLRGLSPTGAQLPTDDAPDK